MTRAGGPETVAAVAAVVDRSVLEAAVRTGVVDRTGRTSRSGAAGPARRLSGRCTSDLALQFCEGGAGRPGRHGKAPAAAPERDDRGREGPDQKVMSCVAFVEPATALTVPALLSAIHFFQKADFALSVTGLVPPAPIVALPTAMTCEPAQRP